MTTAPLRPDDRLAVAEEGAWNPGLECELPREYLPLATVFRTENVSTSLAKARELSDYCGLPLHELVAFRPQRLIVHEVLIRVAAGVAVPDGTDYEDLGRNFRNISSTILDRHISPHERDIAQVFDRARSAATALIARELSRLSSPSPGTPATTGADQGRSWRFSLAFGRSKKQPPPPSEEADQRESRIVSEWSTKAETAKDPLEQACFHALSRVATAVTTRHARLFGDTQLLTDLVVTLVCNDYGSEAIGAAIGPLFDQAVAQEKYRPLTLQARPVVMNVKGASASGKSTMRPFQRILTKKLGLPWEEFALISPDIWRKFLLDYGSLGAAYKYAGMMTGHELEIIDRKLDRHMAARAARGELTHLLIDRFRFDSFVPVSERNKPLNLLTRFGDLVYMFFMITPPEMTVERAWTRGLKVGRYKAVEDLLAHNVEAYTGMPELFFTWALDATRRVHFEFLDNSVPLGRPPRTVAFGWNGEMTILDIKSMLDIDRFRKINIHARRPADVYCEKELAPQRNTEFLKRCARLIPIINFADHATGQIYARIEKGKWKWRDEARFARAQDDPEGRAGLQALALDVNGSGCGVIGAWTDLELDRLHTLGTWGEEDGA